MGVSISDERIEVHVESIFILLFGASAQQLHLYLDKGAINDFLYLSSLHLFSLKSTKIVTKLKMSSFHKTHIGRHPTIGAHSYFQMVVSLFSKELGYSHERSITMMVSFNCNLQSQ